MLLAALPSDAISRNIVSESFLTVITKRPAPNPITGMIPQPVMVSSAIIPQASSYTIEQQISGNVGVQWQDKLATATINSIVPNLNKPAIHYYPYYSVSIANNQLKIINPKNEPHNSGDIFVIHDSSLLRIGKWLYDTCQWSASGIKVNDIEAYSAYIKECIAEINSMNANGTFQAQKDGGSTITVKSADIDAGLWLNQNIAQATPYLTDFEEKTYAAFNNLPMAAIVRTLIYIRSNGDLTKAWQGSTNEFKTMWEAQKGGSFLDKIVTGLEYPFTATYNAFTSPGKVLDDIQHPVTTFGSMGPSPVSQQDALNIDKWGDTNIAPIVAMFGGPAISLAYRAVDTANKLRDAGDARKALDIQTKLMQAVNDRDLTYQQKVITQTGQEIRDWQNKIADLQNQINQIQSGASQPSGSSQSTSAVPVQTHFTGTSLYDSVDGSGIGTELTDILNNAFNSDNENQSTNPQPEKKNYLSYILGGGLILLLLMRKTNHVVIR